MGTVGERKVGADSIGRSFAQFFVEGMQETVQVISMLYIENKKYEEIAWILYGGADEKRLANLRKLVSRGKEYLKKRMADLIVTYKRKGQVPFVREEEE